MDRQPDPRYRLVATPRRHSIYPNPDADRLFGPLPNDGNGEDMDTPRNR